MKSTSVFCLICLFAPVALFAQRSFPSPSIRLHDIQYKALPEPAHSMSLDKLFVVDGHSVALPSTSTQINSLAFSRDGKLLAAGKQHGRLIVWDVASQQVVGVIDTGFPNVGRVAISPDNQFVAAAVASGATVQTWHIPDGKPIATLENSRANVLGLFYVEPNFLVVVSGETNVFDATSGKSVRSFPGDRNALLSNDASELVTVHDSAIVVRNTRDWAVERTLPKLTLPERPVFWDSARGTFLFEDITDDHVIVAARTSDGQLLPGANLSNLPKSTLSFYDFGAIDPSTGLVFGHSAGQLWALDLKTGKTCVSPQMLSNSAELSADGKLLAGAIEPGTPTDNQKDAGVDLWKTADLAKACHMQ